MKTYKRFIIFGWDNYSAKGGENDIAHSEHEFSDAREWIEKHVLSNSNRGREYDQYEIFDCDLRRIVHRRRVN